MNTHKKPNTDTKDIKEHASKTKNDQLNFLFRDHCLDTDYSDTAGKPARHQRVTKKKQTSWYAIFILSIVIVFGYFGHYTNKVQVKGVLASQHNTSHSVSPSTGVIEEIFVKEGEAVTIGQRILRLSKESTSANGATFTLIKEEIESQIQLAEAGKKLTKLKHDQEIRELTKKQEELKTQKEISTEELELQKQLVDSKYKIAQKYNNLIIDGAVSAVAYEEAKKEFLLANIELHKLRKNLKTIISEADGIPLKIEGIKTQKKLALHKIENDLILLNRELINNETSKAIYITAPISGTITALNTALGQNVVIGSVLVSVFPQESLLQAHLYVPPEGIGFVEEKQHANMRISAYPFQKFGQINGKVLNVSHTPYQTNEMPIQLMEVLAPNRTYYKTVVELDRQRIGANGEQRLLKPGLVLEADLMMEKRKIYEWLLAPIHSFTKKYI